MRVVDPRPDRPHVAVMDVLHPKPAEHVPLSTVLLRALAERSWSLHELERIAALHGHESWQVEVLVRRGVRRGWIVHRDDDYGLAPHAQDIRAPEVLEPLTPSPRYRYKTGRPPSAFWTRQLERVAAMRVAESIWVSQPSCSAKLLVRRLRAQITHWRIHGRIQGTWSITHDDEADAVQLMRVA